MVVEHVFVTTLEAPDALRTASQFLASRGFVAPSQTGFQVGGAPAWNVLHMTRGKTSAARAKSVIELPQQMRMEYDRGRVTVAVSALSLAESRATSTSGQPKGRDAREMSDMLMVLAQNLQHLLSDRMDPATLHARWAQFEAQLHHESLRRRRRRIAVALSIFFGLIALAVLIAILAVQ